MEKHEFQPKEWVLVRDYDEQKWKLDIFSHYVAEDVFQYKCIGNNYMECIPYEGNESLLNAVEENTVNEFGDWKVGDKVEVQCSGDDKWYSGEIVDIDPTPKSGSNHKIMPFFVKSDCFNGWNSAASCFCYADQLRKPKKKEKKPFKFGDRVQFREGGEWHDCFFIMDDGTDCNPILIYIPEHNDTDYVDKEDLRHAEG